MFKKGSALSGVLIIVGLVLALWRMHSTEEQVAISHEIKVVQSSKPLDQTSRAPAAIKEFSIPVNDVIKPRVKELQQILDSKNDNDPRLDTDFKILTDGEKKALQERYLAYAPEKFNERGTLAFLIGRNISSKEDINFMNQVLTEAPCKSLSDCSATSPKSTGEAVHLDSANAITLAYPQVVAIKGLENFITRAVTADASLRILAVNSLTAAMSSKSAIVADLARQTLKRITP